MSEEKLKATGRDIYSEVNIMLLLRIMHAKACQVCHTCQVLNEKEVVKWGNKSICFS